jgi:thermitase
MNKSYYVRGRRVTIEEIETGVARMREAPRSRDESQALRQAIRRQAGHDTRVADADMQLKAYDAAGWIFERGSPDAERAATEPQPLAETERAARIFFHPTGGILLGTDQLTVRLDAELSEAECRKILNDEGLDIVRRLKFAPNLYEVAVRPGVDFLDVSVRLHDRKPFIYAEPQFTEQIRPRFQPTDPDYGEQWQWPNINAEEAWAVARGAGVRLAIVDKEFYLAHPDLKDAITTSSGFFDRAGNFVQDLEPDTYPFGNHGTFCAGMAVARANNGGDGCGLANEADLIAISCLPDQAGTQATLARALAYAADPTMEVDGADPADGAHVISCSLGFAVWEMKQVLQDAIDFAVTKGRGGLGTPIFWAVTNAEVEIRFDEVCSYVNVIPVGCSTIKDDHGACGFGPELQFLAPGVDVVSTQAGGGLGVETGTSYAAPIAAGIAALLLSINPALTWIQVRDVIRDTCDKVGGVAYADGRHERFGFGRVNAGNAVRRV